MQWILSLVACYLILIYLHIYTASIFELCCEQLNMEPIALFKSLSISAFLLCSYVLLLLLLSSQIILVFLFHLINLLLVFSWLFNSWSLSIFESEIKSWMMCSLFIRDEESIFEVCNFTSIFFVIIVGRSKYHWIDPIAFPFFWLLYICRFLALKNTKAEQVKFLHICCWSNLYFD